MQTLTNDSVAASLNKEPDPEKSTEFNIKI